MKTKPSFFVSLFISGERLWLSLLTFSVTIVTLIVIGQNHAIEYIKTMQNRHVRMLTRVANVGEVEFFNLKVDRDKSGHSFISAVKNTIPENDDANDQKSQKFTSWLWMNEQKKFGVGGRVTNQEKYLDLIETTKLEFLGRELNWYGYNKSHAFRIARSELDKLDVNSFQMTDNIANQFGVAVQYNEKPPTVVTSWKGLRVNITNIEPSGIIYIAINSGEMKTLDNYFNRNSKLFYQYEPLKLINDGCDAKHNGPKTDYFRVVNSAEKASTAQCVI